MMKISVIIPAAGSGSRFGASRNKIFELIDGQPVFMHTLRAFSRREDVIETIMVCSAVDIDDLHGEFGGEFEQMNVKLVLGGATRTESVRNALAEVSSETDLVAVHDAARPCVGQKSLDAVFAQANKSGAALLAVPIHGTVKRANVAGEITATLPRDAYNDLYEAQTPQVFRREILLRAYDTPSQATDDCALVESIGQAISVVAGDLRNIKITRPEDLEFARAVIGTID